MHITLSYVTPLGAYCCVLQGSEKQYPTFDTYRYIAGAAAKVCTYSRYDILYDLHFNKTITSAVSSYLKYIITFLYWGKGRGGDI
jgi:hypothetical protein